MSRIQDRVALITGSSRGIGAAIARVFVDQGARVALHGRDEQALAKVQADLGRKGAVISACADVTDFGQIEAMRHSIEARLGPVDILVANAGGSIAPPGLLEDIDEQTWRATVDKNLTATFLTIKSFLPGMKARRSGTIITMSSAAARRPHPRSPIPYAAAKAGIHLLTQDVAAQAGPFNIRVNCIAPETILTEDNQQRIPAATQAALIEIHPIKRLGAPEDVARTALFLASDESGWITGAIVDVSGGAVMVS
jgi:3-oxoacyl-[acyl-carrier protein] reductase